MRHEHRCSVRSRGQRLECRLAFCEDMRLQPQVTQALAEVHRYDYLIFNHEYVRHLCSHHVVPQDYVGTTMYYM